ncbi:MAG: 4-(cytidine 5'-diphospho)-2-C-methyl-D-erythritol kinase [Dehalococcoidia bacterium]|nr:4-(cytidine 5'-diphospho)-2-C-methyl-D-erythritol kinase [Dehalococcoidia bacterium]
MRLYAPAKINWTLEVLGRPDHYRGYHEVRTVLQAIDLCDELEIEPADELRLEVEGPHEASEDDLVLRAAALLDGGGGRGARIRLTPRIPVAAGLGGGSSDAAAALRGLNSLWGANRSAQELAELAGRLGSDVPFFVTLGTALAEGRGERVSPLPDVSPTWLVLLVPPIVEMDKTKRMYAALTPADFTDGSRAEAFLDVLGDDAPPDDADLCNAFERAAYEMFAGLAGYREAMLEAGASAVHLAGSGPALFALGPSEEAAREVLVRLRPSGGETLVVATLSAAQVLLAEV